MTLVGKLADRSWSLVVSFFSVYFIFFINIYRLPPLPPTSGPEAWMLGCLDARMPVKGAIWHPRGCGSSDLRAKGVICVTLGLHLGTLGLHLGTLGVHFCIFFPTLGRGPGALGPLVGESLEKVPEMREMGTQSEDICDDFLRFCGK